MKEAVIDALFRGNSISAFGRTVSPDPDYTKLRNRIGEEWEYINSKLSVEDCKRLEELQSLYTKSGQYEERDSFAYGLRLGTVLMCEILLGRESSWLET